ncbi:MAG: hypothetical protein AB7P03_17525 [Kofleriaceae bacterium]
MDQPVVGGVVVFNDNAGGVVSVANADGDGWASGELEPGGSVTHIGDWNLDEDAYAPSLITVLDVQPDEDIVIREGGPVLTGYGFFTVNFTPYPGEFMSYITGPCAQASSGSPGSSSELLVVPDECTAAPVEFRVVAIGFGANQGEAAIARVVDVGYVEGGSVTVPNTWQEPFAVTATFTGVPDGASSIVYTRRSGPAPRAGVDPPITSNVVGGTATRTFATLATATAEYSYAWQFPDGRNKSITEGKAGDEASVQLDVTAHQLPDLDDPELDVASRTITTGVTADVDLMAVRIGYNQGQVPNQWLIVGPPSDQITYPQLPDEFPLSPMQGDPTLLGAGLFDATWIDGYGEARLDAKALMYRLDDEPILGPGARRRVSRRGGVQ